MPPTATYNVKTIVDNPATTVDPDGAAGRARRTSRSAATSQSFGGPLPPNTIAVVNRGTCARVAKAIFGQQAGAAAVVMVNNAAAFPPFEGPITSNPDTGAPFTVTIPFLGIGQRRPASDGGWLRAADGQRRRSRRVAHEPGFTGFASFSSGGPRAGDSCLKPTSPRRASHRLDGHRHRQRRGDDLRHVDGVAARRRRRGARRGRPIPTWRIADIKAAIVNTAIPSGARRIASAAAEPGSSSRPVDDDAGVASSQRGAIRRR